MKLSTRVTRASYLRKTFATLAALAIALIAAPASHAANDPFVYVSLGDSYVSGPLVLPHDQRWVPQGCGQSMRNFAHLAALDLQPDVFTDVSCGGATINDFTRPQDAYVYGQASPQFDALNASVDVVTVGIAGNDVGFVSLALDCIRPTPPPLGDPPCTPKYKHNGVDEISKRVAATAIELGTALDQLHRVAPYAAVLIISYPTALPDDAVACYPYLPILPEDMPYLVEKYKEMNAMLKAVAATHAATYVDIYTPSIGHDACKPPALAWVNGAALVPPSFPAHPNDLSYLNSAPIVAQAIRAALAPKTSAATTTTSTPPVRAASRPDVLPRTGATAAPALSAAALAVTVAALRRRRATPDFF